MAVRPPVPAVAVALLLAPLLAGPRAEAATVLGSTDLEAPREGFACGGCRSGSTVGFRQFALQGATVEALEPGVLVAAGAHLRRIAGTRQAEIAVLRPTDGIKATIAGTAVLPATSTGGAAEEVGDLHLPVQPGDSLALLVPAGHVDLGIRNRPSPDGALVSFSLPCTLCGTDGGTGRELLFQGTVEPDVDEDLLGDESQDPDGGIEEPDDEEILDEEAGVDDEGRPRRRGRLRLLRARPGCDGGATLLLAAPGRGRLSAAATRTARGRRRIPIAAGRVRSTRAGRVRLRMRPTAPGRRLLATGARLRTRLELRYRPRRGRPLVVREALTLRKPACRSER